MKILLLPVAVVVAVGAAVAVVLRSFLSAFADDVFDVALPDD